KADPTPLQTLHNAAAAIPNLALLILDPITHFLGLTDRTINQAQGPQSLGRGGAAGRSTLHALAQLAESRNIAILLTTRLTKKLPAPSRDSLPHLHRTLGSLAFSAAARSTLLILPYTTPHLTNPTNTPIEPNRLLLSLKSNLTPPIPPLPFTLTQTLTFHPEIPLDDLFAPKTADPLSKDTLLADAVRFLQSFLADGPRRATHINDAALQNAVSIATLRRAKSHLQLDTHFDHRHRAWFWFLKDDPRPVPSPAEHLQKEMSALSASLRALHIPSLEDLL
ncbi:MAG TPA: hypothetical protein VHQ47_08435, partial [Phycisphaerae bacterium]|nr:hypothetical protein [Phycisphaerae bacterium]